MEKLIKNIYEAESFMIVLKRLKIRLPKYVIFEILSNLAYDFYKENLNHDDIDQLLLFYKPPFQELVVQYGSFEQFKSIKLEYNEHLIFHTENLETFKYLYQYNKYRLSELDLFIMTHTINNIKIHKYALNLVYINKSYNYQAFMNAYREKNLYLCYMHIRKGAPLHHINENSHPEFFKKLVKYKKKCESKN
jgi:hypothetical protein